MTGIRRLYKCIVWLFIGISFSFAELKAQHTLTASGSEASGSEGAISYTIGQVVYTANTGTDGSVTQGVQQPFEITVLTSLKEANGISLEISVYPNPATDYLTLKVAGSEVSELHYLLYDQTGKLYEHKRMDAPQTSIAMKYYAPATYLLKVIGSKQELKTFKIIKN